jgi:hypothetical protein
MSKAYDGNKKELLIDGSKLPKKDKYTEAELKAY